ncbi:phosphatidylcholine/phosphatidylserine synthase [Beijerinckia sp. L45]|uniref:CDP-alcohol phosphatidyltransferase family protein n=1 Tax=Beijerinckia sp. L45 TaxID=1641855 RepID=UPI00131D6FE5|nr:CDP-alcohol phosphatidyltransferase family protein [Beijerinckia sp. L45]
MTARRRRFRAVPIRLVLPNLVTLAALSMGLTSIRFAVEGKFEIAVVAIVIAAILDGLDGRLARAIRGTSRFGAELDSLADFVDFGVAPAMILYFSSLQEIKSFGWFAALIFAIAAALRLARFNVMLDDPDKPAWHGHFFTGMPAPAGAIVGLLPLYLHLSQVGGVSGIKVPVPLEIGYVILVAFLMASRIPHFSGKKLGRIPREYVIVVLFGVAALLLLLATFPMEVMVVLSLGYLATIPWAIRRFRAYERADERRAVVAESDPTAPGLRPVAPQS